MNSPSRLGSIRNFAWVEPGILARGEQPALVAPTFAALRDAGVTAVLSLRPDREPPSNNARRPWPEYHVEEEQALAEAKQTGIVGKPLTPFLLAALARATEGASVRANRALALNNVRAGAAIARAWAARRSPDTE